MKDFIIVGRGLSAFALAHAFHKQGISFRIIGNETMSNCSRVAAGIWNPVVFKRMTKSWMAEKLIPELKDFFSGCESRMNVKLLHPRRIVRPFTGVQEKNLWRSKAMNDLDDFLKPPSDNEPDEDLRHCRCDEGFGVAEESGYLNTPEFLDASSVYFRDSISSEIFRHNELEITEDQVMYRDMTARGIVFCEGYRVKDNPYFNWLPMSPARGEIMEIRSDQLRLHQSILNKDGFLYRTASGTCRVGATFSWDVLEGVDVTEGRKELNRKLKKMITCAYEEKGTISGIRPSSADRRPLIGSHPRHKRLFIFNGFGAKGVMLAPWFAREFTDFYFREEKLNIEADISRYYRLYNGR